MAVEIATAYVSIVPSAKGIKKAIEDVMGKPLVEQADDSGTKAGQRWADRFNAETGKKLTNFGTKALVGAAAFGAGLLGAAKSASSLNAALSANEQVLGSASKAVQAWAKDSVQNVGLSERAALEASTSFGQLAKIAGLTGDDIGDFSIKFVTLAADMAAFKDVPIDQALADLQSGFAGSTEVLRKYGIFLDEASLKTAYYNATGEKVTGVLTAQQRVVATSTAIMAQSVDMQGQAARESGELARQQDNLKASMENAAAAVGQRVLPAVTGLVQGATSLVNGLASADEATGGLVGGLLLVGTTGLTAAGGIGLIAGKVTGAIAAFRDFGTAAKIATVSAGGLAAAAVAGFIVWQRFQDRQRTLEARTSEVSAALTTQTRETWKLADAAAGADGKVDGLAVAQTALNKALAEGEQGEKITTALGLLGRSAGDTVSILTTLRSGGDAARQMLQQFAVDAGATAEQAFILARAVAEYGDLDTITDELYNLGVDGFDEVARAMNDLDQAAKGSDLDASIRKTLGAFVAEGGPAAEALLKTAEATADVTRTGDGLVGLYDELNRQLEALTPEQRAAVLGADDLAAALAGAADSTEELNTVTGSSIKVITNWDKAMELAGAEADGLKAALDALIGTHLSLDEAGDNLRQGVVDLTESFKEHGASIDANTEAGLANREQIRSQVSNILDFAKAMIDAGHSTDEATAYALANRDALRQQMIQAGLTEEEVDAYLTTLGLTPENVNTAIAVSELEKTKAELQAHLDQIDEIPEDVATAIQADIDDGKLAEADAKLEEWRTRERWIRFGVRVTGTGGVEVKLPGGGKLAAKGAFVPGGSWQTFTTGDVAGRRGDEVILPLGDDAAMSSLISDHRVWPRLSAAVDAIRGDAMTFGASLSSGPPAAPGRGGAQFTGPIQINSPVDLDGFARSLNFHLSG